MTLPSPMECAARAMFCAAMPQSIWEKRVGASTGCLLYTSHIALFADALANLDAVQLGQHHVQKHQIILAGEEFIYGFLAILCRIGLVAVLFKAVFQALDDERLVIDDQYLLRHIYPPKKMCIRDRIATVGQGMVRTRGTAAKLFTSLYRAGVNVRMIDQGSSELNIIVGVDGEEFEAAVRAIYDAFVRGDAEKKENAQ